MQLRHTDTRGIGDVILEDNGDVTVNGILDPDAIVTEYEGSKRISLDSANPMKLHVNPMPEFGRIKVEREIGWQANLGFRVKLLDFNENSIPTNYALAIYQQPGGVDYHYTTGAFQFDEESGLYFAICPPGFEPGKVDIYMGILYGSVQYSVFTFFEQYDEFEFMCAGDIPAQL